MILKLQPVLVCEKCGHILAMTVEEIVLKGIDNIKCPSCEGQNNVKTDT